MNDHDLTTLQAAVRLARNDQIGSADLLRRKMAEAGHAPEDVDRALMTWAKYEQGKRVQA